MISLLAQSAPPAEALKEWLLVLGFLIGIGVGVKKLFFDRAAKDAPQPFEVKAHVTYASKDDLHQVHGRISRERDDANAKINAVATENRELRQKLDEDIGDLRTQIAENNAAGEARVNSLRADMAEQTKLIISVIRKEGAGR